MKPDLDRLVSVVALFIASALCLNAQNGVDAGLFMSGKGIGIAFNICEKSPSEFTAVTVFSDMHGVVTGKNDTPGLRANLIHNFLFNFTIRKRW